jgi:hypothetical protein
MTVLSGSIEKQQLGATKTTLRATKLVAACSWIPRHGRDPNHFSPDLRSNMPPYSLNAIADGLNRFDQRATYGGVAALVDRLVISEMKLHRSGD